MLSMEKACAFFQANELVGAKKDLSDSVIYKPQQANKIAPKFSACFQCWHFFPRLSSSTILKVNSQVLHLM